MTVVDASVWISALSANEVRHDASRKWLADQSADLTIPSLALAEIAGAVTRVTGAPAIGMSAARLVLGSPGLRIVGVSRAVGEIAAQVAANYRLRGADAIYVAIAQILEVPLATLDLEIQERAATAVNIVVP